MGREHTVSEPIVFGTAMSNSSEEPLPDEGTSD
jgi:hypothetical protein